MHPPDFMRTSVSASSSSTSTPPHPGSTIEASTVQESSTDSKSLRKSCQHCRKRKIKCLSSPGSTACKACAAKEQPCLYEKQSQMGRPPKAKTAGGDQQGSGSSSSSLQNTLASGNGQSNSRKRRTLSADGPAKKPKLVASPGSSEAKEHRQADQQVRHNEVHHSHQPQPTRFFPSPSSSLLQPTLQQPLQWQQDGASETYAMHILPMALTNPGNYGNTTASSSSTSASTSASASASGSPSVWQNQSAPPSAALQKAIAGAVCVQTETDPVPFFRNEPLHALAAAFHRILSSSADHLSHASTPVLSDPKVSSIARIRTLTARATASRKPVDRGPHAATPTYARSLISPLWDGLPVDIIALATTGRPSASGPFSISSQASKRSPPMSGAAAAHDEYLYVKLLREDESGEFKLADQSTTAVGKTADPPLHPGMMYPKNSPGFRYAPDKTTVGKFFAGYFSKHPLAPLVLNERIFLEDLLNNRVDPLLLHVIVGSSIARAPCLGAGDDDAEDIGDEFFRYIEEELLYRRLDGANDLQTCQALMLWATHELTHMRVRRANALWSTVDVLLRQRVQAFHARVEEEAAYNRMQQEGHNMSGLITPVPLGWRDLAEQELTVNSIWIIVVWNTWTSLSLKLPHNTMSIMAHNLPAPPQNVNFSSSFAFSYSNPDTVSPLQPVVRRIIERFSDLTQLINVIVALRNQQQVKNMFAPDPPRPLAVIDDEEAQIATWLVDLAKYYQSSDVTERGALNMSGQQQVASQKRLSDSSRSFLIASHAVLALHQILPYATSTSNSYGNPLPLPTVESLQTALSALHVLARSIQVAAPGTRTRTQAILLDSMPRILSLLEVCTSSALSSLDHFVVVMSQRRLVHELLDDLNRAIACMNSPSLIAPNLDSCGDALGKSSKGLRTVVDIGVELHNKQQGSVFLEQPPSGASLGPDYSSQDVGIITAALPGTPSTTSSSADGTHWRSGPTLSYPAYPQPDSTLSLSSGTYNNASNARIDFDSYSNGLVAPPSTFYTGIQAPAQQNQPVAFSMSSHLANSPLMRSREYNDLISPSYVGSLHAFL